MKNLNGLLNLWDFETTPYEFKFEFKKTEINKEKYKNSLAGEEFVILEKKENEDSVEISIKINTDNKEMFILRCMLAIFNSTPKRISNKEYVSIFIKFKEFKYPNSFSDEQIFLDLLNQFYPNHRKCIKKIIEKNIYLDVYSKICF